MLWEYVLGVLYCWNLKSFFSISYCRATLLAAPEVLGPRNSIFHLRCPAVSSTVHLVQLGNESSQMMISST